MDTDSVAIDLKRKIAENQELLDGYRTLLKTLGVESDADAVEEEEESKVKKKLKGAFVTLRKYKTSSSLYKA